MFARVGMFRVHRSTSRLHFGGAVTRPCLTWSACPASEECMCSWTGRRANALGSACGRPRRRRTPVRTLPDGTRRTQQELAVISPQTHSMPTAPAAGVAH